MNKRHLFLSIFSLFLAACVVLAESRNSDAASIKLEQPLIFSPDKIVEGSISTADLDELAKARIVIDDKNNTTEEGYKQSPSSHRLKNCEDYWKYRLYPSNRYDFARGLPFLRNCNVISALRKAKPADKAYYSRLGEVPYEYLPASTIGVVNGEQADLLTGYLAKGLAWKSPIEDGVIAASSKSASDNQLEIEYTLRGYETKNYRSFQELAQADFNGDGIEDFLVETNFYLEQGSYLIYDVGLLLVRDKQSIEWQPFKSYN